MEEIQTQLLRWLDDLCVRFIINLPQEELESAERICFQIEEAQWFYEDFIRPQNPNLPSMSLRDFCLRIFEHCPLFSQYSPDHYMAAFSEFLAYKTRVPVRGAIILDESMENVLLVKGWKKSASWSFPRGKINKDEPDLDCAVREVYEETGYDIAAAGLVHDEAQMKFIEVTMREQHIKLYVFRGVPLDTVFQARTRKEISKIEWYQLSSLPGYRKKKGHQQTQTEGLSANKLYMVAPFLVPLKKWINEQRRKDQQYLSTVADDLAPSGYDTALGYETAANDYQQKLGLTGAAQMRSGDEVQQGAFAASGFGEVAPPPGDMSAELKRMLNLGGGQGQPVLTQTDNMQVHGANHAATMLSMLQGTKPPGPSLDHPSQEQQLLPQPFENQHQFQQPPSTMPREQYAYDHHAQQVSSHGPAHTPTHGYAFTNPSFMSNQPPHAAQPMQHKQYNSREMEWTSQMQQMQQQYNMQSQLIHAQLQQQAQHQNQWAGSSRPQPQVPSFGYSGQHPQGLSMPLDVPPNFDLQRQALQPRAPAFASETPPKIPDAPAASQLPAPQLSSHAKSLLNVFKTTSSTAPSPAAQNTPAAPPRAARAAQPSGFSLIPATIAPSSRRPSAQSRPDSRQSAGVAGGLVPSQVQARTSPSALGAANAVKNDTNPPPTERGEKPANPRSHQDALLRLFKAPGAKDSKPASPALGVVELPAPGTTTPRPAAVSVSRGAAPQTYAQVSKGPQISPPKAVTILQRPKAPESEAPQVVTAPAVPAPPAEPKTPGKQNRARHGHSDRVTVNSPQRRQATPVQILKRPQNANVSPSRDAKNRPKTPQGRAELTGSAPQAQATTPKMFQPQILKRPQGSPSGVVHELPNIAPKKAPEEVVAPKAAGETVPAPQNQRDALLSLFNRPAAAPASAASARTASPSAAGADASVPGNPLADLLHVKAPAEQPRPPPELDTDQEPYRASRQNSTQSVISPSDRGFLMSYLDGMVKGAR